MNEHSLEEIKTDFKKELTDSYIEYAVFVIANRAIPHLRDGLKPVQRRIVFSMLENNNVHNQRFRKSARIIGDVSGKYHPHGEVAIYDALVRMAQPFSTYLPLICGQGNFGSIDGDSPAAQRYTEGRLEEISSIIFEKPSSKTVQMVKNYDGSLMEPVYLLTKIPLCLVNGSSGIAVGFASLIPSHHPLEIIEACLYILSKPDMTCVTPEEVLEFILGPDFPVFCLVDKESVMPLYLHGEGRLVTASQLDIEGQSVLITGLARGVKKNKLIQSIVNAIEEKIIEGVKDIVDESVDSNYKVRVILGDDTDTKSTMKKLKKHTFCTNVEKTTFRFIRNEAPVVMNISELLVSFLNSRVSETRDRLLNENAELLEKIEKYIALLVSVQTNKTGEIIQNVLRSKGHEEIISQLSNMEFDVSHMEEYLPASFKRLSLDQFKLTKMQIEYLLQTPIRRFNKTSIEELTKQMKETGKKIDKNLDNLGSSTKLKAIISTELKDMKKSFKLPRRCILTKLEYKIHNRELEERRDIVVIIGVSNRVYTKNIEDFKIQKRGGKGKAVQIENDKVSCMCKCTSHDDILIVTKLGYSYRANTFDFFYAKKPMEEIISLRCDDQIICITPLDFAQSHQHVFIITKMGYFKKHNTKEFHFFNRNGKKICALMEDDCITSVGFIKNQDCTIALFTKHGKFLMVDNTDMKELINRNTMGVKGIKLKDQDSVVTGFSVEDDDSVYIISSNGFIKKIDTSKQKVSNRNTMGNFCTQERFGGVGYCVAVEHQTQNIAVLTAHKKLIIIEQKNIPTLNRRSKGVKMIEMDDNDEVVFGCVI